MKMRIVTTFLVLAVIMLGSNGSYAFDDGDFQYWNTESASVKINDDLKFNIEEEFRFGDNVHDFYYQHTDVGLIYSGLVDWLVVSANYRGIFSESSGDWSFENRPHLNADLKTKLGDVGLSNRSRLEFRIREGSEDKPRYRNKTTLKMPFKLTKWELKPYVVDEIFMDFESTEISANRFYVGMGGKVYKNVSTDLYYMVQSSKSSGVWGDKETHVIGTKLKIAF